MCLTVSTSETLKLINKKAKTITVYKRLVLKYKDTDLTVKLCPPYIIGAKPYHSGWNVSDSKMKKTCTQDGREIHHGIHVYLDKTYAEDRLEGREVLVRMKVNLEDLLGVSCSGNTAVFKKVYISHKEYLRGLGEA